MMHTPSFVRTFLPAVQSRSQALRISACAPQSRQPSEEDKPTVEIAICKGPTCTKDGSTNTSEILSALLVSQKGVRPTCISTGCLGECGQGPNAVLKIAGERPQMLHGVRTVHAVGNLLTRAEIWPDDKAVSTIEMKHKADVLLQRDEYAEAILAYRDAADGLQECADLYVSVLCNWSCALLRSGDLQEALRVANLAVERQAGRPAAWRRKAEAHERLKETDFAVSAWEMWGKLEGRVEDAAKFIRRCQRRAWLPF